MCVLLGGLALFGTVRTEIRLCKVETWRTLVVSADEGMATSHNGDHNGRWCVEFCHFSFGPGAPSVYFFPEGTRPE